MRLPMDHTGRFIDSTVYVGGAEVYAGERADALEADLRPLVGAGIVTQLSKYDTNPANNPQPR